MSRYLPPAKRTLKKDEPIISLSPEHFPSTLSSPNKSPTPKSTMSFSDCFKPTKKPDEPHKYYRGGISHEVRAKMIADGWVFLSLGILNDPGYCERWNNKMMFHPVTDPWLERSEVYEMQYTGVNEIEDASDHASDDASSVASSTSLEEA